MSIMSSRTSTITDLLPDREVVTAGLDAARQRATTLVEAAGPSLDTAREVVLAGYETAAESMSPYVERARSSLTPVVVSGLALTHDRVVPIVERGVTLSREELAPRLSSLADTVVERSGPALDEALARGEEALKALRGERSSGRHGFLATVGLLLVGAAAGAAVASVLRRPEPAPIPVPPRAYTPPAPPAETSAERRPEADPGTDAR